MFNKEGNNIYCEATGKRCFTYSESKELLRRCGKKHLVHKNAYVPNRAYMCKECNCYHLTSKKKNKARFIPFVMVFALMSCKQLAPTTQAQVEPVKKTYYTVIVNGRSYPDLTLYYQTQCGDTFKMKDGRKIAFRGNYMFYEQTE